MICKNLKEMHDWVEISFEALNCDKTKNILCYIIKYFMQNRTGGKHMQGDIIIIFLFSVPISLCPSHYLFTLVSIGYRMVQVEYVDRGEKEWVCLL